MIFYWFVHHIEGDNGQDIGHTLILGSSLPFHLFSFGYVLVRCVSRPKERPSSTVRARGTKWKRYLRSWRFLARTSTLKVRLFLASPRLLCDVCVTVLARDTQLAAGLAEWPTAEGKSGEKLECVRLLAAFNLQLKCGGCVSKGRSLFQLYWDVAKSIKWRLLLHSASRFIHLGQR